MTDKSELTLEEAIAHALYGLCVNEAMGYSPTERRIICDSFDMVLDAACAHLSRPVVGDEQMREALELAKHVISMFSDEPLPKNNNNYWARRALRLSRALITTSEQLAAEQVKVKALQPYKDAYEAGEELYQSDCGMNDIVPLAFAEERSFLHGEGFEKVRVCKPVKGDG